MKNIFYKIKGLENYNEEYSDALQKEKFLVLQDELNILYVALTRAKNNMIIFKKEKSSVFEYLQLKELKIGQIILSNSMIIKEEKLEKIDYVPLSLGIQEKQISSSKEISEDLLYSKYFGIATHYCLEMLNDFDEKSLDYVISLAKSRYSSFLDENDFKSIKQRVLNLLNSPIFQELIKDSIFVSEQSLMYKEEIKIIDLLLHKNDSYYIIDYKTTKEKQQEHIAQVSYYKKAIKEIFKTSNVFSYLIYLHENEVLIDEVR